MQSQDDKVKSTSAKILDGTSGIINRWLGLPSTLQYRHKSACLHLGNHTPAHTTADSLLYTMFDQIEENWKKRTYSKQPSKENWRFTRELRIASKNTSAEKQIEKKIAEHGGSQWANQVPTSSGITSGTASKKACIDLARKVGDKHYELIELKWQSDTPLFAAMEVLLYAVLYIHAKVHRDEMGYSNGKRPLIKANTIDLRVLAPPMFYKDYNPHWLRWLEQTIHRGVDCFAKNKVEDTQMSFRFLKFKGDSWDSNSDQAAIQTLLSGISLAFLD